MKTTFLAITTLLCFVMTNAQTTPTPTRLESIIHPIHITMEIENRLFTLTKRDTVIEHAEITTEKGISRITKLITMPSNGNDRIAIIKQYDVNTAGKNVRDRFNIKIFQIDGEWCMQGAYIEYTSLAPKLLEEILPLF